MLKTRFGELNPSAPLFMLDGAFETAFENLTALACRVLGVPVALISILDTGRQYFKSQCGLPEPFATARETPLSHSFCQHVAAFAEPLVINDARTHELVRENLAIRDLGVIAYLGYPLFGEDGTAFGSFCAIDTKPRQWSSDDMDIVRALAAQVMSEISVRLVSERRRDQLEFLRMEEKERTASNLSDRHDLRTPLNALLLGMQTIEILGGLNPEQVEYLRMAERNLEAVLGMIDQMLDTGNLRRNEANTFVRACVSPLELISRAVDQVAVLAARRNQSLSSRSASLKPLDVDVEKIVRVLVNLLANAIKFTPGEGSIAVSVRNYSPGMGQPSVLFTISDDGPGVAGEFRERIFEEGFRIDNSAPTKQSSGLGLSFCRKVIEAHGGRIWVESNTGSGSSFHFYLPAKQDEA